MKYNVNVKTGKVHKEVPTEFCLIDDANIIVVDQAYIDAVTEPNWCGYCYSPKYARLRGEKP